MQPPLETILCLLMLRGGWRVSAVAPRQMSELHWSQQAWRIAPGKGRKDRDVSLSADAVAGWRECLTQRPGSVPSARVFWNRKRPHRPLSRKAIPKTMARDAKAAGVAASGPRLRHTLASHLLEQGAASVSMRE
jgi:site-specific recombinase XerD